MRRIVIGLDGSDGSTAALRWAVAEAAVHDASLSALFAWNLLGQPAGFEPTFDQLEARTALEAWLSAVPTEREVESIVVCDLSASALIDASRDADLVVVGSRGLSGVKELLLGSVSCVVAERAVCAVAVIRDSGGHPAGPVVVGVDGSPHAARALRWAADEARARRVPLEVLHAWSGIPALVGGPTVPMPIAGLEVAAERQLTCALASADLSGVVVRRHVVEGTGAGALVRRSASASVVVVGSRGRGNVSAALLGSTSREVLHHAHCPVVVAR